LYVYNALDLIITKSVYYVGDTDLLIKVQPSLLVPKSRE